MNYPFNSSEFANHFEIILMPFLSDSVFVDDRLAHAWRRKWKYSEPHFGHFIVLYWNLIWVMCVQLNPGTLCRRDHRRGTAAVQTRGDILEASIDEMGVS